MGRLECNWIIVLVFACVVCGDDEPRQFRAYPKVFVCILARNKAHALPYFLGQLEELDYPKDRLHLFIRTDHNSDSTSAILRHWTDSVNELYGSIDYVFNDQSASYDDEVGPFDWTDQRYRRIIDLKEKALITARSGDYDYLLYLDADNFLTYPRLLQRLMEWKKPIIAPMLRSMSMYSNFWAGMDEKGYYLRTENYEPIYQRQMQGCLRVPMIHSTFLVDLSDPKTTLLTFDRSKLLDDDLKSNTPLDDVLTLARSAQSADLELHLLNTFDFGYLSEPRDPYETLDDDVESMRYLVLETLFNGPPGLLHSPYVRPLPYLAPKSTEPGDQFDQVYLINLRRRSDRRQRMRMCLDVLGTKAQLIEAVDGKTLTDHQVYQELGIKLMPEYRDPYHNRTMTRGEIGCFLSHFRIWEDVVKNNYRRVLVLEDDLRFVKYFRPTLSALMDETEEKKVQWDLIYLGRKRLNVDKDGPMVGGCRYLSYVGYTYWTISYALTNDGAKKLIDARPFENLVPVDEYLPIMFDRHPQDVWKSHYPVRNLLAFTAEPLLVYPTHYTGEIGYISDTENAPLVDTNSSKDPKSTSPLTSANSAMQNGIKPRSRGDEL